MEEENELNVNALGIRLADTLRDHGNRLKSVLFDYEKEICQVRFSFVQKKDGATNAFGDCEVDFWARASAGGAPAANITLLGRPHFTVYIDNAEDYLQKIEKPLTDPHKYGLISQSSMTIAH